MTLAEVLLWNELKQNKILGYDFDRQRPIGEYIVDFYCKELSLVIEIDGDTHIYRYDYDEKRQFDLEKAGVHFLRFEDIEVKKNMSNVLRVIENWIKKKKPTPGLPLSRDRHSRAGSSTDKGFVKIKKPTPVPSQEGNTIIRGIVKSKKPTPVPSQEGNTIIRGIVKSKKPTPSLPLSRDRHSQEGIKERYISEPVFIGSIPMGGDYPVRLQSMTNTNTLDTKASVAQCIRIIEAGADYVRLTAQGIREAENLANIKKELRKAGFDNPLIADIHFNSAAAETAARIVEKVRINPGNYVDKRAAFIKNEFTDKEYGEELERIHERLLPLINICKENKTVIRVGINHGSLSDRIMTRYGNTPKGMVLSAMEFIKIFLSENFTDLVLSMKSSDTGVVIESNRLLVDMMQAEGVAFPIHLGVTEAGEGEDGRVRSAAGIGALLSEGIGDTVRVSLSEAPEREVPVAKEIVRFICGETGRLTNPAGELKYRSRKDLYRPVVLAEENGIITDEQGKPFSGKMITFIPGEKVMLPSGEKEKIILNPVFNEDDPVRLAIDAAALLGKYFILKQADGICISNRGKVQDAKLKELSFAILQATEARITRTRYISCPTCGRTKFDLPGAVKKVKEATMHLTGLKIAIMGCIVNGPGEMADADYGYVGAGEGKVHIYRGTVPVLKNVPVEEAVGELLRIIGEDL
jgi:(E)-4-hydroxy-3-methylbut-2-enyl-diphosphate synthase